MNAGMEAGVGILSEMPARTSPEGFRTNDLLNGVHCSHPIGLSFGRRCGSHQVLAGIKESRCLWFLHPQQLARVWKLRRVFRGVNKIYFRGNTLWRLSVAPSEKNPHDA